MPLTLPSPPVGTVRSSSAAALVSGHRYTAFRYDLLGRMEDDSGGIIHEALIGRLDGVQGGSVNWKLTSAIKGGGTIDLLDLSQDIDWLNARIRPMVTVESATGLERIEVACGVFIPAAPKESWSSTGCSWSVELLDKNCLLDQDIVTDGAGNAITYSLPAGANVVDAVKQLIAGVNETTPAIDPYPKVLSSPLTWEMGTSRLQIINNLLSAADFDSLWVDGWGQYRTAPYVEPSDRTPIYLGIDPFGDGPTAARSPDWMIDRDIYAVPNRMIAVGQGDGDVEAIVAVVTNEDPFSPFSYQSRGRWITTVDTGVEAVDQAALLAYARRRMTMLSTTAERIEVQHMYLPELLVGSVVRFADSASGMDKTFVIRETDLAFDPLAFSKSILQEVG
jgi:hypothetical protein